jgi:phosphatidylinositol alpha-1,6-mannosyltransferase
MIERPGRAGVAAVSFGGRGGGLAYVARLLRAVCASWQGAEPWTAALEPAHYGVVSRAEQVRFAARVAGAQFAGRIDWLAFNHLGIARVQRFVPRSVRRPYLVFVHDVEAWDPALQPDRLATLTAATLRVANSRYTAQRVSDAHPSIGPVVACPLGLLAHDSATDGPDAGPAGLPGDVPGGIPLSEGLPEIGPSSVLILGRMHDEERYKGHDELLESWPAVVSRVPAAQLVVVGLGNDVSRLRDKARALGVGHCVVFCGFLPSPMLMALMGRVAAFAMPSAREGFGLVYLEAMRAGRPCIGSTSDAAGDIIVHGETGFLVDRTDGSALSGAIIRLLTDDALRVAMGEAGRRRFEAHFTVDRFANRLLDILNDTPMIAHS